MHAWEHFAASFEDDLPAYAIGILEPDSEEAYTVEIPLLLLTAFASNVSIQLQNLIEVPLLTKLLDSWESREKTDSRLIILRAYLHRKVYGRAWCRIEELYPFLRGMEQGRTVIKIPEANFSLHSLNHQFSADRSFVRQLQKLFENGVWATINVGNSPTFDSFVLLEKQQGGLLLVQVQSIPEPLAYWGQ